MGWVICGGLATASVYVFECFFFFFGEGLSTGEVGGVIGSSGVGSGVDSLFSETLDSSKNGPPKGCSVASSNMR